MQLYITFYSLLLLFISLIFLFLPHPIYVVLVSLVFIFTIRLFPRSNSGIIKCIYKNEAIKLFRRQKPNSFLKESLGNFHLFNKWHNQYFISNHFNHIKPNLSIDLFNYKYLFTNIKGDEEVIAQTVSHLFCRKLDLPNFIIASIDSKFVSIGNFGYSETSYFEDSGIIILSDQNIKFEENFIGVILKKIKKDLIIEVQGKSAIIYRYNKIYSNKNYNNITQEALGLLELLCEKPCSISPN